MFLFTIFFISRAKHNQIGFGYVGFLLILVAVLCIKKSKMTKRKRRTIRIVEESDDEPDVSWTTILPGVCSNLRKAIWQMNIDYKNVEYMGTRCRNGALSKMLLKRIKRDSSRTIRRNLPMHKKSCICGADIQHNTICRDSSSGAYFVIGSTCQEKMGVYFKKKHCWRCEKEHGNYSGFYCKPCKEYRDELETHTKSFIR